MDASIRVVVVDVSWDSPLHTGSNYLTRFTTRFEWVVFEKNNAAVRCSVPLWSHSHTCVCLKEQKNNEL